MIGKALHTKSIWKSNLMTDIRLASEAGFGAMEVAATKIWDYLSSGNPWSDVRNFDPNRIYHIHFCDCRLPKEGEIFDETILRGMYAGEGEVPLAEWVQAVKDTGYDGWWSYELVSAKHWQHDVAEVAAKTSRLLDKYVLGK